MSAFRFRDARGGIGPFQIRGLSVNKQVGNREAVMRFAKQGWVRWALIFGAWTLLGLFICSQEFVLRARLRRPIQIGELLAVGFGLCYLWALATPLIFWLIDRFKIERENWLRHSLVHVLASLLLSVSIKVFHDFLLFTFVYSPSPEKPFSIAASVQGFYPIFDYWVLIYWVILLVTHATEFYQRYQEGELKATQLESRLAQAQLQALKTQVNPHFLFNTLHAISTLMYRDVRAANRMLTQLGDLLRLSLETAGAQEVSLRQELEFLDRYIEIQRARFPDRLTVHFEIHPETLDALVPNFILQPLVENAIRHGIAPRSTVGRVEVSARLSNGLLELQIRDTGRGFPTDRLGRLSEGVGLSNTRARLRHLYGAAHRFELRNVPTGGAEVLIVIPFRPAEEFVEEDLAVSEAEFAAADSSEEADAQKDLAIAKPAIREGVL